MRLAKALQYSMVYWMYWPGRDSPSRGLTTSACVRAPSAGSGGISTPAAGAARAIAARTRGAAAVLQRALNGAAAMASTGAALLNCIAQWLRMVAETVILAWSVGADHAGVAHIAAATNAAARRRRGTEHVNLA